MVIHKHHSDNHLPKEIHNQLINGFLELIEQFHYYGK
jgi:hypothetical protein